METMTTSSSSSSGSGGAITTAAAGYADDAGKIQENRQSSPDAGRRDDEDEPKSLIMELYPWMQQFKKMCRASLFQPSMTSLKHLMMYYTRNVRTSVNECYTKPLRAEKLKDSISESLLFFLYYYREIAEDHDRASYMDLMTDLLAMYIDMELKASKRGREHSSKIAARLSSCLQVYLEHSAEHLLDTLIKVHFMTHNYHEILDPVITKIFKVIQEHPSTSVMYVRYFLAYRLWKKLNKNVAVRNQINVSALASLGAAPSDFHPLIIESVLPKVPNAPKLTTKSLLLHKFDVDKCCEEFVKFCKRERELSAAAAAASSRLEQRTCSANAAPTSVPEDNDARVTINNIHNNVVNVSNEAQVKNSFSSSLIPETDGKEAALTKTPAASPLKSSTRRSKKSDIVFIDLTSDNVTEKVIRQKKTRRKLLWLEEAKKRACAKPPATRRPDSPTEDEFPTILQLEDTPSLDCLSIGSPRCREDRDEATPIEASTEERTTPEDCAKIDENSAMDVAEPEISMTRIVDSPEDHRDVCDEPATVPDTAKAASEEKTAKEVQTEAQPEVISTANISTITTMETETTDGATVVSSQPDELFDVDTRISGGGDDRESPSRSAADALRVNDSRQPEKLENNKVAPETRCPSAEPPRIQVAIKAERVTDEPCEIINEESPPTPSSPPVTRLSEPPTAASRLSPEIGCTEEIPHSPAKIRESEFQDNIDGLALLASVSQRVSHLTTSTPRVISSTKGELIKVKNYASLVNSNSIDDEPVTSSDARPPIFSASVPTPSSPVIVNRVVGIYPEDAMDKVAYQVEVTSSGDVDAYENGHDDDVAVNGVVAFPATSVEDACRVLQQPQPQQQQQQLTIPSVVAESTTQQQQQQQTEKEESTNVILNGETVVLFQKSPNSNLYIINKAVENRDVVVAGDDVSGIRDHAEHPSDVGSFGYEFPYDTVYRGQSSLPYDLTQYGRDASVPEVRRRKKKSASDAPGEVGKPSDAMEPTKTGKSVTLPLDVVGKGSAKRKSTNSASMSGRRRRIKQEYTGCGVADLPSRMAPSYGIQDCTQDRVDPSRSSIHIPATHSAPLSSIYTTYTGGADLYLPCHKSCGSMTCGLVNSKGSASGKGHCSCLNCTYGIVAHCGECILPGNETHASAIDKSPYSDADFHRFLPIHSTVSPSVQAAQQDSRVKIFDDQLVCKIELSKPLDGVGVKCEPKEIYRAELDNKLPLKKRFKAMMSVSFEETSIKREKAQSYPGTPMLSIAALDSSQEATIGGNNSLDLSLQERSETGSANHASEMIRRDYRKEMMLPPQSAATVANGYRRSSGNSSSGSNGNSSSGSDGERKRKRRSAANSPSAGGADEASYQRIVKTTAKHRETTATTSSAAKRVAAPTSNKSQVTRPSEKVKELPQQLQPQLQQSEVAVPAKNSTRQTRSSKRNVPKVNYIYTDGDSDWNPSGQGKRKRKKTSR